MASQDENSREIYQYYIKVDTPHTSQNSVTNISNILRYSSVEEAKPMPKQQQMLLDQQQSESQHTRTILSPPVHIPPSELSADERELSQQDDTTFGDDEASSIPGSNSKIQNRRLSEYTFRHKVWTIHSFIRPFLLFDIFQHHRRFTVILNISHNRMLFEHPQIDRHLRDLVIRILCIM